MVKFSILVCCSSIDLEYLFEPCIKSVIKFISGFETIFIVTTEKQKVQLLFKNTPLNIVILSDEEVLNDNERKLCGWSRQQIIKLKAFDFVHDEYVLVIGADTIITQQINMKNFISENEVNLILYRKHLQNNKHYLFEIERCKNVNQILHINNFLPETLQDYIFDFFIFKKSILNSLRSYLEKLYGPTYFQILFPMKIYGYNDMVTIGEWTLYSLYIINISKEKYQLLNGSKFLKQFHTHLELMKYNDIHKVFHFVRNDFDLKQIDSIINKHSHG